MVVKVVVIIMLVVLLLLLEGGDDGQDSRRLLHDHVAMIVAEVGAGAVRTDACNMCQPTQTSRKACAATIIQ